MLAAVPSALPALNKSLLGFQAPASVGLPSDRAGLPTGLQPSVGDLVRHTSQAQGAGLALHIALPGERGGGGMMKPK